MTTSTRTASLRRIVAVANALPETVRDQVVFIGGTVLPLLVDIDTRFDAPRPTKDVDAVMATVSYTRMAQVEDALRKAHFTHAPRGPISRWVAPNAELFDLSTAGDHPGGTGAIVDQMALATAVPIPEHPQLRQLSAVGYFLMKSAAFADRGTQAPYESKDLSDLAVLLVGCKTLAAEAALATPDVRDMIHTKARTLLAFDDFAGALRSHFRDRQPIPPDTPVTLADEAVTALRQL
ncbi:MAG: hypothetical protein P3B98_10955 [Gemmatimonadota bacterium]|nr:hypothetical protein [Gemmatimonadota bacterium]